MTRKQLKQIIKGIINEELDTTNAAPEAPEGGAPEAPEGGAPEGGEGQEQPPTEITITIPIDLAKTLCQLITAAMPKDDEGGAPEGGGDEPSEPGAAPAPVQAEGKNKKKGKNSVKY